MTGVRPDAKEKWPDHFIQDPHFHNFSFDGERPCRRLHRCQLRRVDARAPSGHTAAPAITDMNSRRLIAAPKVQGKGLYRHNLAGGWHLGQRPVTPVG
jgi:hypothetical protein